MANSPNPTVQNVVPMHELKWSDAEKAVARRAFDLALRKELEALIRDAKGRAAKIEEPSELWGLKSWLTKRRREIDRRYDYRYSVLPLVVRAPASRRPPDRRRSARSWTGKARPYSPSFGLLKARSWRGRQANEEPIAPSLGRGAAANSIEYATCWGLPRTCRKLCRNYEGAAPYPIAIEGQEEIKQLVEPRFHPHTPFGRYEAIEPHMDGTDRTYSAASEMQADGCALAY
jgi:hypothetical protein